MKIPEVHGFEKSNKLIFKILLIIILYFCTFTNNLAHAAVCSFKKECFCTNPDKLLSVLCVNQKLTDVPKNIPQNVRILDLSSNSLLKLNSGSFPSNLMSLRRLDLHRCSLYSISSRTFAGMKNLTELSLGQNFLREIVPDLFIELTNLKNLSLSGNQLLSLPSHSFMGLSLKSLNLNDNRNMIDIHDDLFYGASIETISMDMCPFKDLPLILFQPLKNSLKYFHWSHSLRPLEINSELFAGLQLEHIQLSDNKISNISFLNNLTSEIIDLSSNKIDSFNFSKYDIISQTTKLILSDNNIKELHAPNLFTQNYNEIYSIHNITNFSSYRPAPQIVNRLSSLDLSHNSISSLSEDILHIFEKLSYLNLQRNKFECDCRVKWLAQWVHNQKNVSIRGAPCQGFVQKLLVESNCRPPWLISTEETANSSGLFIVCKAMGSPELNITWAVNFSNSDALAHISEKKESLGNQSIQIHTSRLLLQDIQPKNACLSIQCIAKNSFGVDIWTNYSCYDMNYNIHSVFEKSIDIHYITFVICTFFASVLFLILIISIIYTLRQRFQSFPQCCLQITRGQHRALIVDCEDDL